MRGLCVIVDDVFVLVENLSIFNMNVSEVRSKLIFDTNKKV